MTSSFRVLNCTYNSTKLVVIIRLRILRHILPNELAITFILCRDTVIFMTVVFPDDEHDSNVNGSGVLFMVHVIVIFMTVVFSLRCDSNVNGSSVLLIMDVIVMLMEECSLDDECDGNVNGNSVLLMDVIVMLMAIVFS